MALLRQSSLMPRKHIAPKHKPYQPSADTVLICKRKKRYVNKLDAERAAELGMLQDTALNLSVYKCDTCQKWHLTSR